MTPPFHLPYRIPVKTADEAVEEAKARARAEGWVVKTLVSCRQQPNGDWIVTLAVRSADEVRGVSAPLVLIYLVAIVVANLSVAAFGPSVTVVNAFLFIGLDLTLRDRLHDAWQGRGLVIRMALLIAAGGLISYVLNRDAGPIALASTVAFAVAAALDGTAYALLGDRTRLLRINGLNVVGAAADSLIFPTLAFGALLPVVVLGQFLAKVAGGFVWSLILAIPLRRRPV